MTFLRLILLGLLMQTGLAHAACSGLYNHQFKTLQGEPFNFCEYQDKPILVVNTASKCGFTPQFEALEKLYEDYKDKGLLVVGFPSNDFKQELKSDSKIGDFCKMTYGVKFPMMSKSAVRGSDVNPFYKQLAERTGKAPKWNFYKYLILPNEKEVYVFSSLVKPDSKKIVNKIQSALSD